MRKRRDIDVCLAIIASVFCPVLVTLAQNPSPPPRTAGQPGVTIEEVIVTGSNIPTAEEVGPNPVDSYRPQDIERLGIRNATDLTTFLPQEQAAPSTRTSAMAVMVRSNSICAACCPKKPSY